MVFYKKSHFNGLHDRAVAATRINAQKQASSKGRNVALSNRPLAQKVPTAQTAVGRGTKRVLRGRKAGVQITTGRKKVTSDMQTHKNPTLRAQTAVPALSPGKSAGGAGSKSKPGATTGGQPPKVELKDHKVWQIEFHKDNQDIKVQTDIKQSVYVSQCENSVVQIKGKVNSVTVDSCKNTSVVFDSLLSQVEVINSQNVEVQSLGALPTISIQTVPEQFKFKITFDAAGNKLKTEMLDIA